VELESNGGMVVFVGSNSINVFCLKNECYNRLGLHLERI